jgi:DNA-binding transcriptional MerR regulator
MEYSSKHVELLYGVSHETVRRWTDEFAQYLSHSANPGKGRHRNFNDADMSVLSLVAENKKQGLTFEEIHAALKSGQRGNSPSLPAVDMQAMVLGEQEKQLQIEVDYLRRTLTEALAEAKQGQIYKEENVKIHAELDFANQRLDDLKERFQETAQELENAREEIKKLSRELGESYVRGVMETLERRGDLSKKAD